MAQYLPGKNPKRFREYEINELKKYYIFMNTSYLYIG